MIKNILAIACSTLLASGLVAQVRGGINRSAPKVTNAIEMGGKKLHIEYTSIRFGDGEWQKIQEQKDAYEGFNKFAENKPIGKVVTTTDVMVAGKKVPAGSYKMYFTLHEQAGWILNVKPENGDPIRWRMVLSETKDAAKCLKISLEPTSKDGACTLGITFGSMQVTVPVTAVAAEK